MKSAFGYIFTLFQHQIIYELQFHGVFCDMFVSYITYSCCTKATIVIHSRFGLFSEIKCILTSITYITTPYHNKPSPGGHANYNFVGPLLGHH